MTDKRYTYYYIGKKQHQESLVREVLNNDTIQRHFHLWLIANKDSVPLSSYNILMHYLDRKQWDCFQYESLRALRDCFPQIWAISMWLHIRELPCDRKKSLPKIHASQFIKENQNGNVDSTD